MPILTIDTDVVGLSGVNPRVIYIYTNDDNSAITTTGYLNSAARSGTTFSNSDMALVYGTNLDSGSPGAAWFQVQVENGNVSLISASGALPSLPLSVPNGGTGDASHVAYSVLCGGVSTTSAIQSVAALGSSGQVLTSNGAGALPSFQSVAGTGTITRVGDVTSGAAFDGTQGTTLTGTSAGLTLNVASVSSSIGAPVAISSGQTSDTNGTGGQLSLTTGTGGSTSGNGGQIVIATGEALGSSSGDSGTISITTGNSTSGNSGNFSMNCGSAGGNGGGGTVEVKAGTAAGSGDGGFALFWGGDSGGTGNGGYTQLIGGYAGGTSGNGGAAAVFGGACFSAAGNGGAVQVESGYATNGSPGLVTVRGGGGGGTDQAGGDIIVGTGVGTGVGTLGKMYLQAAAGGTASGTANQVLIHRGTVGSIITGLTSGSYATLVTLSLADNTFGAGKIVYVVECTDGTDYQSVSGECFYTVFQSPGPTYAGQATDGANATYVTSGSLTVASSVSNNTVGITATTNLTPTLFRITYMVMNNSQTDIAVS
jgi:hypothetical protein